MFFIHSPLAGHQVVPMSQPLYIIPDVTDAMAVFTCALLSVIIAISFPPAFSKAHFTSIVMEATPAGVR